jgi:hypothetical protein
VVSKSQLVDIAALKAAHRRDDQKTDDLA